ncbi:MAG: hypothetical protein NZ853_10340 [Leptospiraceae bacterium]|nr:hypothetical protein [Leptospiraceae bacterium]MDW7974944.1 hypothetical protein [Leptospiraceae bacterium]
MLLVRPKFRIAIHYTDPKDIYKRHGDLFVEFPKYPDLVTFEIDPYYLEFLKNQYKFYYLIVSDGKLKSYLDKDVPIMESRQSIYEKHYNCDFIRVSLKRKQDHRKEYLQKEGEVSNHRGRVETFTISYLSGIVFSDMDELLIVDYD